MPELRRLAAELVNRPVVPTPDLDAVRVRAGHYRQQRLTRASAAAVALTLVVGLLGAQVVGGGEGVSRVDAADGGGPDLPFDPSIITLPTVPGVTPSSTTTTAGDGTTTTTSSTSTTSTTAPPNEACPGGHNAGATDVGVTGDKIKVLVSQTALSSVQGYVNRVNSEGGVCGRRLELATNGDGFAVIPDASNSGDRTTVVPVVGGDGAVKGQYESEWTWQVGTSTSSQVRMMAKDAWDRGARKFAIVYDSQNRFGTEAASSYESYVNKLGGTLVRKLPLEPGRASYASEVNDFNSACANNACDAVAIVLDPSTAVTWMAGNPTRGRIVTDATHTLMSQQFAQQCASRCDGLRVWTPYVPPIENYGPAVQQYVNDVRASSPTVDIYDAQVQRAYLGARLLVQGLQSVGANLTRTRLQSALDGLTFSSGMAQPMRWTDFRWANLSAQPVMIRAGGSFSGFQTQGGFRSDPTPGIFA